MSITLLMSDLVSIEKPNINPAIFSHDFVVDTRFRMLEQCSVGGGKPLFSTAINNLPRADINYVTNISGSFNPNTRLLLTFNRLVNPICECCGNKEDITKLMICNRCCLSWYCNKACATSHHETHKLRCCKSDGPLDEGFQKIVMFKTRPLERTEGPLK